MSKFHDLLARVVDESVRNALKAEYEQATKHKKFGLVFEEHLPECTPLWGVKIRRGMAVARKDGDFNDILNVQRIKDGIATCWHASKNAPEDIALDDLIPIVRFGDPIYPILTPMDTVENAPGDKLWHALIQADNYHALQLLEYLYGGKVDCIYIDPPYNTGARDWKYNNDYVDANDAYRHSKWLSMMQKRLRIAKKLLNPRDSVLIVTIDEKEYLHLGMLLEEMFPEARMQMVSSVINPKGSVKDGQLTRCEEYLYFVCIGETKLQGGATDFLVDSEKQEVRWPGLKRTGTHSLRKDRPNLFYPIFYDARTGRFDSVGDVVGIGKDRSSVSVRNGLVAVWPLDEKGNEGIWQLGPQTLEELASNGYVDFGRVKNGSATPYYVSQGIRDQIKNGEIKIVSRSNDGVVSLAYAAGVKAKLPKTVWNVTLHSASEHGTKLITNLIGEKKFSFPKSLYAVKDTIRCVVANKPNALILDFFAGSGTTLHAVNLLNAEDGGKRRCILVTNNEVSEEEAKAFRKQGLKPGDAEWEAKGIAQYVTWPRTTCSIKGVDVKGMPLKGAYLGGDKDNPRQMADGFQANAAFFKLEFVDKDSVALGKQFKELLSILWMKSGARGKCPKVTQQVPAMLVLAENEFAVLTDEASFRDFEQKVKSVADIRDVYLVTDSNAAFKEMALHFPDRRCIQLYRDYLDNFRINKGRR